MNYIVYCLISNCYYKPDDTAINTGNVDIKATTVYLQTSVSCLHMRDYCMLPLSRKKPDYFATLL